MPHPDRGQSALHPGAGIDPHMHEKLIIDGRTLWLRPIRADDVEALRRCFTRLSVNEIRMRFFYVMPELPLDMAQALCNIDPAEEAAWVLIESLADGYEIRGAGRLFHDDACNEAEFSVLVEKAWTGYGLGARLMQQLVDYCQEQTIARLWGYVLMVNRPMLGLCKKLGFTRRPLMGDPGTALLTLDFPSST